MFRYKKTGQMAALRLFTAGLFLIFMMTGCTGNPGQKSHQSTGHQAPDPGWTALFDGQSLEGWEITNFGTQGPVQVSAGKIVLGMGDGCTGVTWKGAFPVMNYEVKLEARKVTGNDFFCGMTFPVNESFCSLIVGGWGGPVVGLSCIDGHDASGNETRVLKKYDQDTWYKIHLKVTPGKIKAWIDGEQAVNFSTANRKLSIRPEVELSKPFGICSWITTAELKNIHLRKMDVSD